MPYWHDSHYNKGVKSFYPFIILCAVLVLPVSVPAQIYVPQNKQKEQKKTPFFYDWFRKKPSVIVRQQQPSRTDQKRNQTNEEYERERAKEFPQQDSISYRDQLNKRPPDVIASTGRAERTSQCSTKEKNIVRSVRQYNKVNNNNITAKARGGSLSATKGKAYKEIQAFTNDPKGMRYIALLLKKCGALVEDR